MDDREVTAGLLTAAVPGPSSCAAGCATPSRQLWSLGPFGVNRCPDCGLYALFARDGGELVQRLDRTQYEGALRALRLTNYGHILSALERRAPLAGRTLLDVGCSAGWFLQQARARGCEVYGIEPDEFFYERCRSDPALAERVVHGYFDRDLPGEWGQFDVITFHDVFEHLPDPIRVLRACRQRLAAGGQVLLALPMADGFIFRLARGLYRCGVPAPLARMFQTDFPFPHLFYYSRRSLAVLARRAGFELVHLDRLRSVATSGALHRARLYGGSGLAPRLWAYANAAALVGFAAVEPVLPPDSSFAILRPAPA